MIKFLRYPAQLSALGLAILALSIISAGPVVRATAQAATTAATGRSFVYTITNPDGPNTIAAYERNPETGELVFLDVYPTGGQGTGRMIDSQSPLVVNSAGTLLFAVNPGSNDISVMAIHDDGSLELREGPVPSRGAAPASLALSDALLYVANKGDAVDPPTFSGFSVQPDGSLTRIKRRIVLAFGDNPTQVLFTPDGRKLIGIRLGSSGLDTYVVKPNGRLRLSSQLNNQSGPFAAVFNPIAEQQLLVADARLPGASSYGVSEDGVISPITAVSNRPERAACWIAAHSDGARVWVSNTGTNSVSLYTVAADGSLDLAGTHNTAGFGRTPFEIALAEDNRHLYQLNVGSGNQSIHALRVMDGRDAAGLADIGAIGLPAGSSPIGLVVTNQVGLGAQRLK